MAYKLQVSFWNWKKQNNQGLCDFKQISRKDEKKFFVGEPGIIYRNLIDYKLMFVPIKKVPESGQVEQHQPMFSIRQQDYSYKIIDLKNHVQSLSLKVPDISQNLPKKTCINKGTIIKLGKATIEVIKIKPDILASTCTLYQRPQKPLIQNMKKITFSHYNFQKLVSFHQQKTRKQSTQIYELELQKQVEERQESQFSLFVDNPACKVCLSRTLEKDNSLISLCKCKGSTRFIHQQCLKNWIKQKSRFTGFDRNGQKAIYVASMQGFKCEICKQQYCIDQIFQLLVQENSQKFQEYVALAVNYQQSKLLYIINLKIIPQIKIGRDLNNDISLPNQLTVSRNHCVIQRISKQLQLVDLSSKFGTLIKKPSLLVGNQSLMLQKGRTYFEINRIKSVKKSNFFSNFTICCPESL